MYLGNLVEMRPLKANAYLMRVWLAAAWKCITRKWLKKETPTMNE